MTPKTSPAVKRLAGTIAVLGIITLLGAHRIADPFHGDHALFLHYAKALARGSVLYVDIWDLKQPGIFWFFLAAGKLFDFSEPGVRLFELIYQLTFSAILIATLRGSLRRAWLAVLAPIACVGVYYARTSVWHLTQVEFLAAFPLYLALWLAAAPSPSARQRRLAHFSAGVCAGFVVIFKLPLALVVAAGWVTSLWTSRDPFSMGPWLRDRLAPAASGLLLTLGGIILWFAHHEALWALGWTSFVYPLQASAEIPHASWWKLARSIEWFIICAAPWVILAGAAGVRWRGRRDEWLTMQLFAWLAAGLAVILLQKFSWWGYHFTLFIVPVGLLAVRGADGLIAAAHPSARRATSLTLVAVLFATPVAVEFWRLWRARFEQLTILASVRDTQRVSEYQRRFNPTYRQIWRDTRFLAEQGALPGPIYVFGNPLYFQFSGRDQAIPTHGWSWEFLLESQWAALPAQLARAAPVYIFVDPAYEQQLRARSPRTLEWIESEYVTLFASSAGTWYVASQALRAWRRGPVGR